MVSLHTVRSSDPCNHYAHEATQHEPAPYKSTGFGELNCWATVASECGTVGAAAYHAGWEMGRGVALSLKLASWSPVLSASQTPSYSVPVEHWFSTLLAHIIPPFLRGKLLGWKKKGLPVIDWSTALLNSGYKLREMRREGEQWGWRQCAAGGFAC